MPLTIAIRTATPSDHAQWLPLWHGYNHFYHRSGPTALPEEVTQTTWARFHDPDEPMYCLVAELQVSSASKLVGIVHYLFHRNTITIAPTCYLNDLFTDEAYRGKGIARQLVEAVAEQARQAGSSRVYWLTHETNLTAMKLYDKVAEKSGFLVYRKPLA